MSNALLSACWPLQMPPTPKAVLISLADSANEYGECWPSIPRIRERTCFSQRAIQNAIGWLEGSGALSADRSNGRHTRYVVTPEAFSPPHEMPEPRHDVHPRTTCTPAAAASTPAGDAPHHGTTCTPPPQEVPSNPKEPSRTITKSNPKARAQKTELPDWLPVAAWGDWRDYRKAGKSPMTPKAEELSIRSLDALRLQGHDPTGVIENAIERGWRGLYAPTRPPQQQPAKPSAAANFRGKSYAGTPIDQLPADLRAAATAALEHD